VTERMREALAAAENAPLRRVHDVAHGQAPWPAHPASIAALVRQGLLEKPRRRISRNGHPIDEWFITEAGCEALKPRQVVRREAVRSLRVPGGSTRVMQGGVWVDAAMPEPEPVDPDEVDAAWFGAAAVRHAEARDRRHRAAQIVSKRKAA
jgi:hypothetical protein